MVAHPEVDRVLALLEGGAPRLGGRHLLCIDGPAGSGKTTLARAVAQAHHDACVIHLDDLLDGWDGLPRVAETLVRDVLAPLAQHRPARYRRHDWLNDRPGALVEVAETALLVVEGVGAGSRVTAPYRTASVWLDAPTDVRRTRALARDGDAFAARWDSWARAEADLFAVERPELTADLSISSFV